MLRSLPSILGRALSSRRSTYADLLCADCGLSAVPEVIMLSSPAFDADGPLPIGCTDDGNGRSPPLEWTGVPPEALGLVLLVEDQDAPTPRPLVHAVLTLLEAKDGRLAAGALPSSGHAGDPNLTGWIGRNSFMRRGWLPPDPPPGHGMHRYVFQLFALDHRPAPGDVRSRIALRGQLVGHTLAFGTLTGTFLRG